MSAPSNIGINTLYHDLKCPHCEGVVSSGIGFRAGSINRLSLKVGQKLSWDGANCRPASRPIEGNLRTIGYFNCDNPRCETWQDCFPEVQEALITIRGDVIEAVSVTTHKPGEQSFDIIES